MKVGYHSRKEGKQVMADKYKKRVFISFDSTCPMKCKHCYTYELDLQKKERSIAELVNSLEGKEFDVIYVSKSYENFYNEEKGIDLCNALWNRFHKDIFIITRRFLTDQGMEQLADLNERMSQSGNRLYFGISVLAMESSFEVENIEHCPSALERLQNLKRAKEYGLKTILIVRPLLPANIIPLEEPMELIRQSKDFIDAVISSGLIVTDKILKNLNYDRKDIKYLEYGDSAYLADLQGKSVKYVDVRSEIEELRRYCTENGLAFFEHSMPALNAL